ncbi:MAG TPA: hypothetical protein VGY30_02360 [Solirubrobacteraceae bacterium]|jgi:hypothetical protein|nr:hypothetical protein [Solirubrobacteraceae bacterium]
MRLHNIRRLTLATAAAMLTVAGSSLAASGGLSISPGIFEHLASRGSVGSINISNTTRMPMAVRVALRPWLQALGGEVSPNRRATLPEVRVSVSSFTLGAGSSRTVGVSLTRTPAGHSQYGAIEVAGTPSGHSVKGIRLAYRLVASLRLDAPRGAQSFRARAGGLVEQGSSKQGTLLLAVQNTGNTIVPIGGTVGVSGQGRSLRANATAKTVVPGATVNVPLVQLLGSLPRGRYTVTVGLSQGGHGLGTVTRTIELR